MLPQENLNTWDEFEKKIRDLEESTKRMKNDSKAIYATTEVLYRGEGNAGWPYPLSSTLERKFGQITLEQYFKYVTPGYGSLKQQSAKLDNIGHIYLFPTAEADTREVISVMAELRHKGFLSPLVDWTSDYLVAAFFALRKSVKG